MKISEMINNLKQIQEKYGDLECIYSQDDEGNYYYPVAYNPTAMEYNFEEREVYTGEDGNPVNINAVCVN